MSRKQLILWLPFETRADVGIQRYIAHGPYLIDPRLGEEGQKQADVTGKWLHHLFVKLENLNLNFKEIPSLTSSLDRCIETAKRVNTGIYNDEKIRPVLTVLDWPREWLGWDHNSNTDKRTTKSEIVERYKSSVHLEFQEGFTADDEMFNRSPLRESWTEVGRRWVKAVDLAFQKYGKGPRICLLFGNNRSIQCGLRELGLEVDEEKVATSEPPGKLIVEDMENAAVMALVVDRFKPTQKQIAERNEQWKKMEVEDIPKIKALGKVEMEEAKAQLCKVLTGDLRGEFLSIVPKEKMEEVRKSSGY